MEFLRGALELKYMHSPSAEELELEQRLSQQDFSQQDLSHYPQGESLQDFGARFGYDDVDVDCLTQEIIDGTVDDDMFLLFRDWSCKKLENYDTAKRYIRELGLDQGYDTARIANRRVRQLVEEVEHFRPASPHGKGKSDDHERVLSLVELLRASPDELNEAAAENAENLETQERAFKESLESPQKSEKSLRAVPDSPTPMRSPRILSSLRKTTSRLRVRTKGLKQSSPYTSPMTASAQHESAIFESHITEPLVSPLHAPTASARVNSLPVLKEKPSVSASPFATYPPDTPERPAPLSIRSRTANAALPSGALRSVSTPVRSRFGPPPSLAPTSPLPALPSGVRPPRYHLFPQQTAQRQPQTRTSPARKVSHEQRRAAQLAAEEAREANHAAMSGFDAIAQGAGGYSGRVEADGEGLGAEVGLGEVGGEEEERVVDGGAGGDLGDVEEDEMDEVAEVNRALARMRASGWGRF
ncbi:hypothetical protein BU23DRAFT_646233 [Bimuria novae-zelandiae CBS 107.79]|uniref:Uncharacterized protein n=1 Tax=Bimuria novae-zelandiae CBS 107.79 TaxID=1447943 RepID=A0A6A5V4X7_9PLEO|nr:hypothetical protein BU23DRAFT_646233 [Bimuria novae-zelandiae CBS 107.79]